MYVGEAPRRVDSGRAVHGARSGPGDDQAAHELLGDGEVENEVAAGCESGEVDTVEPVLEQAEDFG